MPRKGPPPSLGCFRSSGIDPRFDPLKLPARRKRTITRQPTIRVSRGQQYSGIRGNDDNHLPSHSCAIRLERFVGRVEGYPTRSRFIAVNIVKAHFGRWVYRNALTRKCRLNCVAQSAGHNGLEYSLCDVHGY